MAVKDYTAAFDEHGDKLDDTLPVFVTDPASYERWDLCVATAIRLTGSPLESEDVIRASRWLNSKRAP